MEMSVSQSATIDVITVNEKICLKLYKKKKLLSCLSLVIMVVVMSLEINNVPSIEFKLIECSIDNLSWDCDCDTEQSLSGVFLKNDDNLLSVDIPEHKSIVFFKPVLIKSMSKQIIKEQHRVPIWNLNSNESFVFHQTVFSDFNLYEYVKSNLTHNYTGRTLLLVDGLGVAREILVGEPDTSPFNSSDVGQIIRPYFPVYVGSCMTDGIIYFFIVLKWTTLVITTIGLINNESLWTFIVKYVNR
jgi:hypothetical protein